MVSLGLQQQEGKERGLRKLKAHPRKSPPNQGDRNIPSLLLWLGRRVGMVSSNTECSWELGIPALPLGASAAPSQHLSPES